ncbi:MAG TPA: transcription factor S [Candidatus Aenigmarchaeota archaeon]|nr:transcription factor S [Candidatus Aenigmarchaeota archaeon]
MVKFCKKCGNLLVVEKKRKHKYLVCRKCGYREILKGKVSIKEVKREKKREVIVMGKEEGVAQLPKTKIMCPRCENMEAYWWMQQTRSADEPPTIFYKCTKCGYSWRSYG